MQGQNHDGQTGQGKNPKDEPDPPQTEVRTKTLLTRSIRLLLADIKRKKPG